MPRRIPTTLLLAAVVLSLGGCAQGAPKSASKGAPAGAAATTPAAIETSAPAPADNAAPGKVPAALPGKPSVSEATTALKAMVYANSNHVVIASVSYLKIARDSKGRWWISGWAEPVPEAQTDTALVFMYKSGKRWVLFDLGTGIDQSELPKDVRGKL